MQCVIHLPLKLTYLIDIKMAADGIIIMYRCNIIICYNTSTARMLIAKRFLAVFISKCDRSEFAFAHRWANLPLWLFRFLTRLISTLRGRGGNSDLRTLHFSFPLTRGLPIASQSIARQWRQKWGFYLLSSPRYSQLGSANYMLVNGTLSYYSY